MNKGLQYLEEKSRELLFDLEKRKLLRALTSQKLDIDLVGTIQELSEASYRAFCCSKISENDRFNLSINDYLGLGRSGAFLKGCSKLAEFLPAGAFGSRLLGGNHKVFDLIESYYRDLVGAESSLYLGSGFAANLELAKILSFDEVCFFSDSLNHASMIDGIRSSGLSKSKRFVFPHRDYSELENKLASSTAKCNIIFCESLYSMDGTESDLKKVVELSRKYSGVVVLDEAHSVGLYGEKGRGLLFEDYPSLPDNVILVSPLGKAVSSSGSFISGPKYIRDLIINTSRSFIYSTAPSPLQVGASFLSLKTIEILDDERSRLNKISNTFRYELSSQGISIADSECHIVPVVTGCEETALDVASKLNGMGITCGAIRPPTVPVNSARVRLSLHAGLKEEDLDSLLKKVKSVVL